MGVEGKNVIILPASYIVGLTEGEGCFLVVLRNDNRIDMRFFITQAIGNHDLLLKVRDFFQVGSVYQKKSARDGRLPAYVFEVTKRNDILNVIIPFFSKHKLIGYKAKSFEAFRRISEIINGRFDTRKLLNKELEEVSILKYGMNKHYGSPGAENPLAGSLDRN